MYSHRMRSVFNICDSTLLNRRLLLPNKINIVDFIYKTYRPDSIELGQVFTSKLYDYNKTHNMNISPNKVPILDLFNYCKQHILNTELYVLSLSIEDVYMAKKSGVTHFSFMISVSDQHQYIMTTNTIAESKLNLSIMYKMLDPNDKVKLYINCIDTCPISGKLNLTIILSEILSYIYIYSEYNFDEICLVDTCGTLRMESLDYIYDSLRSIMPINRISIQLCKQSKHNDTDIIIHNNLGIDKFNVSLSNGITEGILTEGTLTEGILTEPIPIHYSDLNKHIYI